MKQVEGWRHINEETGELYPWYTKPVLELLDSMDLSQKTVFEYGIGDSSKWWVKRCKLLCGVESNIEWFDKINIDIGTKARFEFTDNPSRYVKSIHDYGRFDIVIIDGIEREKCVMPALYSLNKGGIIIYDNWDQASVELQSEETQKTLLQFNHTIYPQKGHDDWKTLWVNI